MSVLSEHRDISRQDVRRFALATGALDPLHHEVEVAQAAGYPDLLAPAYFFVSLGLSFHRLRPRAELGPAGLPLDDPLAGRRVVAGGSEVSWAGDIFAGDRITVAQQLLGVTHKSGGRSGPLDFYEFERTYSRGDQVLVRERFVRIGR